MKTPREILSQLQRLSTTCETPEDGILKALKIIGEYGLDAKREGMVSAAKMVELANIPPKSKLNILTEISVKMQTETIMAKNLGRDA